MRAPTDLYRPSLALLTDLYQLTMAAAVHANEATRREAVFHLFFRRPPFGGGYAVAAGLASALDYLSHAHFDDEDLAYLAAQTGADEKPLFTREFLEHLRTATHELDVDAVPEGTVVFPHEPLLRVRGPIIGCMLAETALLTLVNFATLIATKTARIVQAAQGEPVLEFGLRRAQGVDGALTASRSAWIGGAAATSNVLAGRLFGIPVKGTHAHSWVMLWDDEREAFERYAKALPNNCVFLVDTYDTLEGVRRSVEVGRWLRLHGHELLGVRLDSGDLAQLSIDARRILDDGGFPEARIFASNDLDERLIESLKHQGATINVWGVGTRLVTASDDPALGGVYKLSAVRDPGGPWRSRIKVSEQSAKTSTPGIQQIRRFRVDGQLFADGVYDLERGWPEGPRSIVDPFDATRVTLVPNEAVAEDVLQPAMRGGKAVLGDDLDEARARCAHQLAELPRGVKRFMNPHLYPVGLEPGLMQARTQMILAARKVKP